MHIEQDFDISHITVVLGAPLRARRALVIGISGDDGFTPCLVVSGVRYLPRQRNQE